MPKANTTFETKTLFGECFSTLKNKTKGRVRNIIYIIRGSSTGTSSSFYQGIKIMPSMMSLIKLIIVNQDHRLKYIHIEAAIFI
jgi:hypothetical protein